MKHEKPGYPLPSGDASEDELLCTLVYYPNRKEYRQAFVSSLLYLGTWLAWERDDDHRGKDAADSWVIANELTLECLYMGCLDELLAELVAIKELLQNSDACCDDNTSYGPSDEHTTDIVPDSGDPPDYYGETAVTDWDDWKEHVCHNAHLWLDELILQSGNIETALNYGGMAVGLAAAAVVAVSFFVVGGVVSLPFIYAMISGLVAGFTANMFSDSADDLEDSRDDIVCAFINGGDVAGAIEDALDSTVAWNLFYSLIDYDSAIAIVYEGGDGTTYLEADTRDDCDCDQVGEYQVTFTFDGPSWENWQKTNGYLSGTHGNPVPGIYADYNSGFLWVAINGLLAKAGLSLSSPGDYVLINRIIYDYKMDNANVGTLYLDQNSGSRTWGEANVTSWTSAQKIDSPGYQVTHGNTCLRFRTVSGTTNRFDIDNVMFDFDVYRA